MVYDVQIDWVVCVISVDLVVWGVSMNLGSFRGHGGATFSVVRAV